MNSAAFLFPARTPAVPPALARVPGRFITRSSLTLAAAAALLSFWLSGRLGAELFQAYAADVWFQADLQRVIENMTDAGSNHYRNKVHPIASLLVYPFTKLLQVLLPLPDLLAARAASAIWAGLWALVLHALMVTLGLGPVAAAAFVLLAISSGSFVMFFSVPELYHLGSLSMMAVLLGAAVAARQGIGERAVLGLGIGSLAITTTNWMAGLALAFSHLPWRRALRLSVLVLAITAVLAIVQKLVFPSSGLFFLAPSGETLYVGRDEAGTVWHRLAAMLFHPMVVPDLVSLPPAKSDLWSLLSAQKSPPGGSRGTGIFALAIWIALLLAGLAGARHLGPAYRRFLFVLFATLAGQIGLHLVYGEETFLYGLHFLPFLLTVAALSWFSPWRPAVVPAVCLLAVLVVVNNLAAFAEAASHVERSLTERERLKRAMAARPDAGWPRNQGHVVLGGPGTPLSRKGFHEPGGSFSPAPGSFGVSVWVTDASGARIATSDTIPLAQVRQSLGAPGAAAVPALSTNTPYYQSTWSWEGDHFALRLTPAAMQAGQRLWVLLRSAGPSGAPLRSIRSEGARLILNERWEVATRSAASAVLGDESRGDIDLRPVAMAAQARAATLRVKHDVQDVQDVQRPAHRGGGWLFAAVPVGDSGFQLRITDANAPGGATLPASAGYWAPVVPDERFAAMAHAQQAHLLMGLTDLGTRPGEPVSYDFEQVRDGAYVVASLARAGQLRTVERLAESLAVRDYFGGFGAEADAPGLAIWALAEVARAVQSPAFDAWAWPHVRRKAALILACMDATATVVAEPALPVLQSYRDDPLTRRPCEAAMNGLAVGVTEHRYPILYVNAVSHLGLREAAALARRLHEDSQATAWESRADALAAAWRAKFMQTPRQALAGLLSSPAELARGFLRQQVGFKRRVIDWLSASDDERTYVAAAWPSTVLSQDRAVTAAFQARLEQRWARERSASGAYREPPRRSETGFAQAHQWLALGQADRAWATLDYFMNASVSPGLYTWWEAALEDDASYRWNSVRGWTDPSRITPHYGSAAQALLLQMAMLTSFDGPGAADAIVIGAGVPREWLTHRIDSGTIRTPQGPVRWVWEAGRLVVDTPDAAVRVRLAPVFEGSQLTAFPGALRTTGGARAAAPDRDQQASSSPSPGAAQEVR